MSKSLGNGIDPNKIVDVYGADALKFTLCFMCAQGQDIMIDDEAFKFGSKFANKIWNASRYILSNLDGREIVPITENDLNELDRWIFHRLNVTAKTMREALETYRYNDSAQAVYEFFWNDFCDWYVEATKLAMKSGDDAEKNRTISVLLAVLEESLRLLHPHVPFVTEEIYSKLPAHCVFGAKQKAEHLITAAFPEFCSTRVSEAAEKKFNALQEIVRNIRALRSECGIEPQAKLHCSLLVQENSPAAESKNRREIIVMLAGLRELEFINSVEQKPKSSVGTVGEGFEAFIVAGEGADVEKLIARFEKELEREKGNLAKLEGKLKNQNFIANAPVDVVEKDKETLAEIERRIEKLSNYKRDLSSR